VLGVCKSLCHHARHRCTAVTGGDKLGAQVAALSRPQDVVICTPGRLLQHVQDNTVYLGDVQYLILDEADTMFDAGFGADIKKLLVPLRRHDNKQCVMVAATMSKPVRALMTEQVLRRASLLDSQ